MDSRRWMVTLTHAGMWGFGEARRDWGLATDERKPPATAPAPPPPSRHPARTLPPGQDQCSHRHPPSFPAPGGLDANLPPSRGPGALVSLRGRCLSSRPAPRPGRRLLSETRWPRGCRCARSVFFPSHLFPLNLWSPWPFPPSFLP